MPSSKRIGHYVASTHWDREWYEPLMGYRFRLVELMDELLDVMAGDPHFRYFQTDGQAILIEDYLEIRPERREDIASLAKAGRLRIGPWYVLPDEFIVSGESLIRNLQMGLKVASRYGSPARVGFVCDIFGHTSQMPQILRGFGIDNALLWRGVNESTAGGAFRWQGADGSEVIAYHFNSLGGYGVYTFKVRKANLPEPAFDLDEALAGLRELVDDELRRCPTSSFLVFDGCDHMEIEPQTPQLLNKANKKFKDVELVHSHLEGFIEDLREQRDRITRVVQGELRAPSAMGEDGFLIPGVLSSRIPLKQANARCENELCLWAEPFSTFAASLGRAYPARYLELAWQYLLQNHAHDSICACSIDPVHKDMVYRFDQCEAIASRVTHEALAHIASRVECPPIAPPDFTVVVFNPSADAIDGPVDLTLRFPKDLDTVYQEFFGFEPKIGFRLFDAQGEELPYQYVNHRRDRVGFHRRRRQLPSLDTRHEVDVTVPLQVPPYGYTRILCRPVKEPTRHLGSMLLNDHAMGNEFLEVAAAGDGTLAVTDKRSGQSYERLLTLEDCADIGDGWYHGVAVNDQVCSSKGSSVQIAVTADGIAKATLTIRVTMQVPERFGFDVMRRSESLAPLVVTHHVTLRRKSEVIEVRTEVENTIRDHRLRVLFPTRANALTYLADAAFDVVERPIALRADNARLRELEVETRPQQTWTAVADEARGLAVVSTGLPESAVRDLPERPIALTLLRSFIKAVLTSGQEGGQIQGHHEFRYLIVPFTGEPNVASLCRWGQKLAAGTRAFQVEPGDGRGDKKDGGPSRDLPASHSFLTLGSPDAIVTAVHGPGGDEVATIRMFNPKRTGIEVPVTPSRAPFEAQCADLEGRPGDPLKPKHGTVSVSLAPKKIETILFRGKAQRRE